MCALLVLPLVLVRLCLLSTLRRSWVFFPLATGQLTWDLGDKTKNIAVALEENYLHNNPPSITFYAEIIKSINMWKTMNLKARQRLHKHWDASSTQHSVCSCTGISLAARRSWTMEISNLKSCQFHLEKLQHKALSFGLEEPISQTAGSDCCKLLWRITEDEEV